MTGLLRPRALVLLALGLALVLYMGVVASRTDVIAIVDTGDGGDPIALATLALLDAGGGAVSARGEDNYAVALNTEDGTTLAESAFLITYAASGRVDQTNAAIAYSSCEACQTFAFAIEVVLVPADKADVVTPTNAAIAVNEECATCTTAAFATQIVLGVDGPVGFTEEGNEEIEDIMEDLAQLEEDAESGDLTLEEIQARYDELVARLNEVLANELVPLGNGGDSSDTESTVPEMTLEPGEGTETTTPSTTEGTSPEATAEETLPETTAPEETLQQDPTESSIPEGTQPISEGTVPAAGAVGEGTAVQ